MRTFNDLEKDIDVSLEKLVTHPTFLKTVGTVLNLNSYRKILMNRALTAGWKFLQLPNKRDQERTLHLINELHHKIAELEARLEVTRDKDSPPSRSSTKVSKKKFASDANSVAIQ